MDKTKKLFDEWAVTGRAEEMEKGHGVTVNKFLDSISFDKPFLVENHLICIKRFPLILYHMSFNM